MGLRTVWTIHGWGLHSDEAETDEATELRLYMDGTTLGQDYAVETTYKRDI